MLKLDNINVFYGDLQVLWDVSLEIRKGELVAVIGANCAGKSTCLKTIIGLLHPRSGAIVFNGERIDKLPTSKIVNMGISLVPEGGWVFPEMTVMENLEMGAYTRRARRAFKENLKQIFELFPVLKDRIGQKAGTLSGGERQMLSIARALLNDPELLMLDEPSLGLSPMLVQKMFETIVKINKRGVTVLLVEQNATSALEICNRGYVLESGRIMMEGVREKLLNNDEIKKSYLGIV